MMTSYYDFNWTTTLDVLAGAAFAVDLVVSLHAGFVATYNQKRLLVLHGRLAARFTARTTLAFDLASTAAWLVQIALIAARRASGDSFDPNAALVAMEALRLLRFARIVPLLRQMVTTALYAVSTETAGGRRVLSRNQLLVLTVFYLICVLVNFLGCAWNFTAAAEGLEGTWVNTFPPFVARAAANGEYLTEDEARNVLNQGYLWLAGCYWALTTITTVGYGDVTPVTPAETAVAMAVEAIGILFFGFLLSTTVEVMQRTSVAARRLFLFRQKMQSVDRWVAANALPARLRRRVQRYFAEVWVRQAESKEETDTFRELPAALRTEVAWHCAAEAARRVPILARLSDRTRYLLCSKMMYPVRFGPGTDLAAEGDPADRFWLLVEGEVVALQQVRGCCWVVVWVVGWLSGW